MIVRYGKNVLSLSRQEIFSYYHIQDGNCISQSVTISPFLIILLTKISKDRKYLKFGYKQQDADVLAMDDKNMTTR